jgi:hypothetical protein
VLAPLEGVEMFAHRDVSGRPGSPRVARALQLLTEELNATPATLPGDPRPLTYQLAEA